MYISRTIFASILLGILVIAKILTMVGVTHPFLSTILLPEVVVAFVVVAGLIVVFPLIKSTTTLFFWVIVILLVAVIVAHYLYR